MSKDSLIISGFTAAPDDDMHAGIASRRHVLVKLVREAICEFLCAFLLVFFVSCVVLITGNPVHGGTQQSRSLLVLLGLINGLIVSAIIFTFNQISGAFLNPSIVIATCITGHFPTPSKAPIFIISQLFGSIAGAGAASIFPNALEESYGATLPGDGFGIGHAFAMELILTFFLTFVAYATGFDSQRSYGKFGAIPVALYVFAAVLAGAYVSGASMNPARSFGPAVVSGNFRGHWIYWVAPTVGAITGGVTYTVVMQVKTSAPPSSVN